MTAPAYEVICVLFFRQYEEKYVGATIGRPLSEITEK